MPRENTIQVSWLRFSRTEAHPILGPEVGQFGTVCFVVAADGRYEERRSWVISVAISKSCAASARGRLTPPTTAWPIAVRTATTPPTSGPPSATQAKVSGETGIGVVS